MKHTDGPVTTETNLDDTFLTSQFLMENFAEAFRLDRHKKGNHDIYSWRSS